MDKVKKLQYELKNRLIKNDLKLIIDKLNLEISKESKLFNDFILVSGAYEQIKNEIFRELINEQQKDIKLAKLRGKLIYIIDRLDNESLIIEKNEITKNSFDLSSDRRLGYTDFKLKDASEKVKISARNLEDSIKIITENNHKYNTSIENLVKILSKFDGNKDKDWIIRKKIITKFFFSLDENTKFNHKISKVAIMQCYDYTTKFLLYIQEIFAQDYDICEISSNRMKDHLRESIQIFEYGKNKITESNSIDRNLNFEIISKDAIREFDKFIDSREKIILFYSNMIGAAMSMINSL